MFLKHYIKKTGKDIIIRFPKKIIRSVEFLAEFRKFKSRADKRFKLKVQDLYPCLSDRLQTTPFDSHYIYHPAWAARKIKQISPSEHVDISSILSFCTIVSAFVPVRFYDYRPAVLQLSGLHSDAQDLKQLTFPDNSIESLSCMHTVEHIGLGRYGDELDPQGDLQAIDELKRVLKPGGNILFVTPVGKPRVEFNAHRVYSFEQIVDAFHPFTLKEFSLINDKGQFIADADPNLVAAQQYGCGCFWFIK